MSNDLEWLHKFVINILKHVRSLHAESMTTSYTSLYLYAFLGELRYFL